MGGTTSPTTFTALAINPSTTNDEFVLGGSSSDPALVSQVATPNAFAVYVGSSGQYMWTAQFDANAFDGVDAIQFSSDSSSVIVGLNPFALAVLDAGTGALLAAYQESGTQQGTIGEMVMDNSDVVYVAMQSASALWQILAFDLS